MNENIELRDIPGFEGRYAASKDGKIWSHKHKRFMKPCGEEGNYQLVMLCKGDGKDKTYYIHRLVAMAWLPNPDNLPQVNHKDERKDNNCLDNLEWCTAHYNLEYSNVWRRMRKSKPVYCIELDKTFKSIFIAAKELNIGQANLSSHLSKNTPKSVGGYHFRYAHE